MTTTSEAWAPVDRRTALSTQEMAMALGMSYTYLMKTVKDPSGPFKVFVHYVPKSPCSRPWLLWDKARTLAAWSQYCSHCPVIQQLQSRLELVKAIRAASDEDTAASLLETWLMTETPRP